MAPRLTARPGGGRRGWGTNERPSSGRDMGVLVRMANYAVACLEVGDARVFLGIVLPLDGEPGLRRRQATAAKFLPDFGVALYCGFRVQPGSTPEQAIAEHRNVVRAVRRP